MVGLTLSVLPWLLGMAPLADVQVAIGARAELQAGRARLLPDRPAEATVGAQLTPVAGLRWMRGESGFTLRYLPRFSFRSPNLLQLTRPLLMHQGTAALFHRLSSRVSWQALVDGSLGEVDYVASPLVLRSRSARPVNTPLLKFQAYNAELRALHTLSAHSNLTSWLRGGYLAPYDQGDVFTDTLSFPYQRYGSIGVSYEARLSPLDQLRFPLEVRRDDFSQVALHGGDTPLPATRSAFFGGPRYLAARLEVGWQRRGPSGSTTDLGAGALVVRDLEGANAGRERWMPVAHLDLSRELSHLRRARWVARTHLDVFGLLDPVRADYRPLGSAGVALEGLFAPHWSCALQGVFTTTLTPTPLRPAESESIISLGVPIFYSFTPSAGIEFGARIFGRASHWSAERFTIQELQTWAYLALSVAFGTGHRRPLWVLAEAEGAPAIGADPTERQLSSREAAAEEALAPGGPSAPLPPVSPAGVVSSGSAPAGTGAGQAAPRP